MIRRSVDFLLCGRSRHEEIEIDFRRTGNRLRLWAEVFHVASTGTGTVKWQQISEDLVPVSLTCVQDSPTYVFHVTAYNSHVDKILDVRITQPGTRIGQASECFVYWKDMTTLDTWGLNFTSPMDARQFREVCSPSFKYSRSKNGSSYSLKEKKAKNGGKSKNKTASTPSSPTAAREPQCTCMTSEQYARLRSQEQRCKGSSTLPRMQAVPTSGRSTPAGGPALQMSVDSASGASTGRPSNISSQYASMRAGCHHPAVTVHDRPASAMPCMSDAAGASTPTGRHQASRSQSGRSRRDMLLASAAMRSVDLSDSEMARQMRCRSSDDVAASNGEYGHRDGASTTPVGTAARQQRRSIATATIAGHGSLESPITSPDIPRRHGPQAPHQTLMSAAAGRPSMRPDGYMSEPDTHRRSRHSGHQEQMMSSDNYRYNNVCYATTPSSSNSDLAMNVVETEPNSPTYTRLLQEYERHLRNALERGDDAESYSLHTFEAMISSSQDQIAMERQSSGAHRRTLPHAPQRRNENRRLHECEWATQPRQPTGAKYNQAQITSGQHSATLRRCTSLSREDSLRNRQTTGEVDGRVHRHTNSTQAALTSQQWYYQPSCDKRYARMSNQTSLDSVGDSKLCYLTSSEFSEDERMSLTTMVTDEDDDGDSMRGTLTCNLPQSAGASGSSASFNCTGAVRKAGFLLVKKWLLRKGQQLELARRRGWRGYWVCLKGTTLLFYPCESDDGRSIEHSPKHLIIVHGAVMQAVPEHPKKENVFCLSTAFGDAYLFQASSQNDVERWIANIHCACAAAFSRHRGKTGTLHLLQEEIFRLERAIEAEAKLKQMAEVQLSGASDIERKMALASQLCRHEESLERQHSEQFRLRCYMASLQAGELPNPKGLLAYVTRSTKLTLNRLGVFTVSSLHAHICARAPNLISNLLAGRGSTKRRAPMLSRSGSGADGTCTRANDGQGGPDSYRTCRVRFHGDQVATVHIKEDMTVEGLLFAACSKKNVNPLASFVRVKKCKDSKMAHFYVPHRSDLIEPYLQTHEIVEIQPKVLFQVELSRTGVDQMWGFSVEAELVENADRQDELFCYISRVEEISLAGKNGLARADEIMVINGAVVADLDMMYIESVLQDELALCLMVRSSRTEVPESGNLRRSTDEIIERLVCPPPPLEQTTEDGDIPSLIVPSVMDWKNSQNEGMGCPPPPSDISERSNISAAEIDNLIKNANQVTGFCRSPVDSGRGAGSGECDSPISSVASGHSQTPMTGRQMTHADRLRKVLTELLHTERTYVKHLDCLIVKYLEPLRLECFVTAAELAALFGNIPEIVRFQRQFLKSLEEAIEMETGLNRLDSPTQFKNVLFSIGNAFLYHNDGFKLYSSLCSSHSRTQKILHPSEGNIQLQQFLQRQNPGQQHSSTLESYLIKPIQRILKYPLLLQQLKCLADSNSGEQHHLDEALRAMEKVAEHINEMQRIHEEYGAIFGHLSRQYHKASSHLLPSTTSMELSPADLLYYGGVDWLNVADFLGKVKKGLELHTMCFVFKSAVILLCKERLRQKKKMMSGNGKSNPSEVEIVRYQTLIPVTEVQVRAVPGRDSCERYLWELIHLKSQIHRRSEKIYQMSSSSSEHRNIFLKTIRQIIRESVRNMSIPLSRMSSTTSGGSSGGGFYRPGTLHSQRGVNVRRRPPSNYATLHRHSMVVTGGRVMGAESRRDWNCAVEVPGRHCTPVTAVNADGTDLSASVSSVTSSQSLVRHQPRPNPPHNAARNGGGAAGLVASNDDGRDDTSRSEADDEEVAAVTASISTTCSSTSTRPAVIAATTATGHAEARKMRSDLAQLNVAAASAGSTGSGYGVGGAGGGGETAYARLVQASNDPEHFRTQDNDMAGSPVWKLRHEVPQMPATAYSTATLPTARSQAAVSQVTMPVYATIDRAASSTAPRPISAPQSRHPMRTAMKR